MICFLVPAGEDVLMRDYLATWGQPLAPRMRILPYETLTRQREFESGLYILSALDRLAPGMERLVATWHAQLAASAGIRFLNHPARTLRRYALLTELSRAGINDFRAVRAADDLGGLRYPVFLRAERSHEGPLSPLLQSIAGVEAAIGRAIVQGHTLDDLLVVEHCDTIGQDGFYRKYAAFVVGRAILPRHLVFGRGWALKHADGEYTRDRMQEEFDFVRHNPHEAQLAEIVRVAGVEYGRIDYAIKDGRVETWEINLNPTICRGNRPSSGRVPPELEPLRNERNEFFFSRLRAALEAVDSTTTGSSPVSVVLDAHLARGALEPRRHQGRVSSAVKRALRPVKPWIEPIVTPLLPLLGRLARAAGRRAPGP